MKQINLNSLFLAGIIIFAVAQLLRHIMPAAYLIGEFLAGAGAGLVIIGAIKMAVSKHTKDSKLYQWKQGLLGKAKN